MASRNYSNSPVSNEGSTVSFMTLAISFIVFLATPLWAQDNSRTAPVNTRCEVQAEENEVFVSYLKAEKPSPGLTVLVTRTVPADMDVDTFNLQLAVKGRGIPPEVRADFKEKNKSSCTIAPFSGVVNLRFISKGEHDQIFQTGWTEFHERYGKEASILWLSRVGFNRDKTLALLYVSSGMGRLAVGGVLYLLERKEAKWVIKTRLQVYVS